MNKNILIIGGMGPQASITLHQKIIDRAVLDGAKNGDEFPAITHVSIPVPEFIDSVSEKDSALAVIRQHLYCLWQSRLYPYSYCM